ncbi:MAG: hypothetical protein PWQ37_1729 [Candidatus Petromonas sp.]|nr:hypothetical protein [Candidatus Petromonas sp.]
MIDDIKSAGGWFVGKYAGLIFEKYDQLKSDRVYKTEFIKQLFRESGRDSKREGTRTRVNALMRIIEREEIIKALEYVIESDNINRSDQEAVQIAKQTLQNLKYNK